MHTFLFSEFRKLFSSFRPFCEIMRPIILNVYRSPLMFCVFFFFFCSHFFFLTESITWYYFICWIQNVTKNMAVFFFNLLKSFVQMVLKLAYFCKRSEDDYNWIVFSFFFPCYFGSKGQRKRKTYNFCLAITSNYFLYITS